VYLKPEAGFNVINRYNRQYAVTLFANVEGKSVGDATDQVESLLKEILPTGYTYEIGGQTKEFKEAFKYLGIALVVAIIAVYMILASLFESLIHPFTVLLMLPFSIFGIFGFIILTGTIVAALIPVAFGLTAGSEMRQPLAIAIIGGLFTALPLSLFVIPIIYELLDHVDRFFMKIKIKQSSQLTSAVS